MKYTAIIDGVSCEIELVRKDPRNIDASIGGVQYQLGAQEIEPGIYWLQYNNRSIEVSVSPNSEAYAVSIGGQRFEIEIVDARSALRKAALHGHAGAVELRAPMPGKVVKLLVRDGQDVDLNQGLMVIEAMKMQNEIKSPKKGTVRKMGVREAAAVNAGDLLVVVE
jgi:biotin carboxyl carrier protein